MTSVRITNMLAIFLVSAAAVAAALGWPRTSGIALSIAVYLLIRSVEALRASPTRPEN